ncbi:MAG: Ca2+-dependent phosphoinositide-specific phospholipase C [bacterium]
MGRGFETNLSQCNFAAQCLRTIAQWSRTHRQHHPLLIILQPNARDTLEPWMARVEALISDTFQRWQIITPGEVTAGYPDLRTALAERGWPAIELSRGRTMFVLNDRGRTRDAYLAGRFLDPDEPRLLFTVADSPEVPYAGIFSFPDVTAANQAQIRALVEQGYLVRAITNTEDAVQRAIDNGVHFLSTRYPDDLLPPDRLGGFPSGCNPVTTDETCDPSMIGFPPQ